MITIFEETTKKPITMIGKMAGVCYGSDITDDAKNYKRGIDCLKSNHGRTWEFPSVYVVIDEYSARVIREVYTHIGGDPTRLQASTRYINYSKGFDYFTPPTIENNPEAKAIYDNMMLYISSSLQILEELGIPKEDSANGLPLGMMSKMVGKYNPRTLIDMSHQRECTRAYHEFRKLFAEWKKELSAYSEEWKYLVDNYFEPKCELTGACPEKFGCGRKPCKEKETC